MSFSATPQSLEASSPISAPSPNDSQLLSADSAVADSVVEIEHSLLPDLLLSFEKISCPPIKWLAPHTLFVSQNNELSTSEKTFFVSVVTPCYNSAKYLDDYFTSLINQRLNFENSIEVICVDDGSSDNTMEIILQWIQKYPANIRYIYKDNGGAASARNIGMHYANAPWIAFIDSDDTIGKKYFKIAHQELQKNENAFVRMIVCKQLAYIERTKKFEDRHPLNFRFRSQNKRITLKENTSFIQVAQACTMISNDIVKYHEIHAKDDIVPIFEDGEMMAQYMKSMENYDVLLSDKMVYYPRKRISGNSLYTSAMDHESYYISPFRDGMLRTLQEMRKKFGNAPRYVQDAILFSLRQNIRRITSYKKERKLDKQSIKKFEKFASKIAKLIDDSTIMQPYVANFGPVFQFLFLHHFKKSESAPRILHLEYVKHDTLSVKFSYYHSGNAPRIQFFINNEQIEPYATKITSEVFLRNLPVHTEQAWIACNNLSDIISCKAIDSPNPVFIEYENKRIPSGVTVRRLAKASTKKKKHTMTRGGKFLYWLSGFWLYRKRYQDSWVFIDRPDKADDNAEHMYRYMRQTHPENRYYFLLEKDSPHWARLEKEGFNLIPYGSWNHIFALIHCKFLLSSHIGKGANTFLSRSLAPFAKFKFIYFGHGPMKDDLSASLNKFSIDCFTRVTHDEYAYITSPSSPYNLTSAEVVLTGFPRHDALLQGSPVPEKEILFMLTWRKQFAVMQDGGTRRGRDSNFYESTYASSINVFFNSPQLETLLKENGYSITFIPHPNMEQYLDGFQLPAYVKSGKAEDLGGYQDIFRRSAILITDFSSVAFDMAHLKRSVIYYQFDNKAFFSGKHTITKGYYDYRTHGFGPIASTHEDLLQYLGVAINNNAQPEEIYLERIHNTFAHFDTNNCARIYEAIMNLTRPLASRSKN